jgi:hypothetical protein
MLAAKSASVSAAAASGTTVSYEVHTRSPRKYQSPVVGASRALGVGWLHGKVSTSI